jgi:hypothetical protein
VSRSTIIIAGLLVAGIASGIAGAGLTRVTPTVLIGLGLALASAAAVAVNTILVNRHCGKGSSGANSAYAAAICSLPFLPFLITNPPSVHSAVVVALIALTCWVPASLLSWCANPRLALTLTTRQGPRPPLVFPRVAPGAETGLGPAGQPRPGLAAAASVRWPPAGSVAISNVRPMRLRRASERVCRSVRTARSAITASPSTTAIPSGASSATTGAAAAA